MKRLLFVILASVLLFGQTSFAETTTIIKRFATDAETTAQTRDDVGLTPANLPYLPPNLAGINHHFAGTVIDPNGAYTVDHEICIHLGVDDDITITSIKITCDADPDTELDIDLKWADAFIGMANAAIIDVCNTTSGTTSIVSGFDDATIASGKCVYWSFGAEPDAAITQFGFDIIWDYD